MKKFIFTLCTLFVCVASHADTETMNWYKDGELYATTTCESGGDVILPTAPTKTGYTFEGWGANYTRLQYLESTGTQIIDTGLVAQPDCRIEIRYRINLMQDVFHGVYGAHTTDVEPNVRHLYDNNRDFLINNDKLSDGYNDNFPKLRVGNDYIEQMDSKKWIINGTTYNNLTIRTLPTLATMKLFDRSFNSNARGLYGRIYYFKMWNNDSLVLDLVPALDPYGVACMYDKVTGMFFYNQGSGDFVAGPIAVED